MEPAIYTRSPPRQVALPTIVFAAWSLLVSTLGQVHVLCNSFHPFVSKDTFVSAANMLAFFVAFLSTIGGTWLVAMVKPQPTQAIRLDSENTALLETFVNEKAFAAEPVEVDEEGDTAQEIYMPYFIVGNLCIGEPSTVDCIAFPS